MKKIAILQSNYIPWKGYFDLIAAVDEFILFDDMQYTRRDWRNRNKIKTSNGLKWLTIPVYVKGKYLQKIKETEISNPDWGGLHWKILIQNYSHSPCFNEIAHWLEPLFLENSFTLLSQSNRMFIEAICSYLGLKTVIRNSSDYNLIEGKTERLVDLCRQAGGTEYLSGPAAKTYMDESVFHESNIKITWFNYEGYPEYDQMWDGFEHNVTILDLLFNCGIESHHFMKYTK